MSEISSSPNVLEAYRTLVRSVSPRPRGWSGVVGNTRAVEMVQEAIEAGRVQNRAPSHMLLFGPPGMGKSTISEIVAAEIGGGIVSTTASTLETSVDIIRILDQLNDACERTGKPSTLFIDEIHMLGYSKGRLAVDVESIFPLLEDWFFPHNMKGKPYQGHDGGTYTPREDRYLVWPFTCVGATTDPGMLVQPLLRRFLVHIELDPYSEADIAQIMQGAAARLEWPMEPEAAVELARYSRRNPGRAYQLLTAAHNRALATGRSTMSVDLVSEVIRRMNLYPQGLTDTDVRALTILADRMPRGVGVAELTRALNISPSQFTGMIEPYLRLLNFIETLSRRVIRPEGLAYLAQIERIDRTRPEVRAALAQ